MFIGVKRQYKGVNRLFIYVGGRRVAPLHSHVRSKGRVSHPVLPRGGVGRRLDERWDAVVVLVHEIRFKRLHAIPTPQEKRVSLAKPSH